MDLLVSVAEMAVRYLFSWTRCFNINLSHCFHTCYTMATFWGYVAGDFIN